MLLPASAAPISYRREIDGLRAVAVLAVILFHAGFERFSGGYVGVDVFFVISGYLITSIILAETSAGTFTLAAFYERRARRLLPALFLVLLVCMPLAWALLLPKDLKAFGQALLSVGLFASNFFFHGGEGYFAADAELNPLLHTWSLAVEEQYYLVYPVLLLLALRLGTRQRLMGALALAAILSLAGAQWNMQRNPSAAFYLLPWRAWELLLGAMLAVRHSAPTCVRPGRWSAEAGAAVGLALVVYAVFGFDRQTPVPGVHALVPTLGAGLVILFADARTAVGRLLGARLPVGIGLISYSAYLWHQPFFAFTRHATAEPPSAWLMGGVTLAVFYVAVLSWACVEKPFREKFVPRRPTTYAVAGFASAAFIAIGAAVHHADGFPGRVTGSQRDVLAYAEYEFLGVYRQGTCMLVLDQAPDAWKECQAAQKGALLMWGDSHAAALSFGLRELVPELTQFTGTGCPPLQGLAQGLRPRCADATAFVLEQLPRLAPAKILLHANWAMYPRADVIRTLGGTIDAIRARLPDAEVTVIGPVPQWRPSLPAYLSSRHLGLEAEYAVSTAALGELRAVDGFLRDVAQGRGAGFVSAIELSCKGEECGATTRYRGKIMPVAWDYGHLTSGGAVFLATRLMER
jgi:peptidoglycan/LPS O-acetylase OafA/YrhL